MKNTNATNMTTTIFININLDLMVIRSKTPIALKDLELSKSTRNCFLVENNVAYHDDMLFFEVEYKEPRYSVTDDINIGNRGFTLEDSTHLPCSAFVDMKYLPLQLLTAKTFEYRTQMSGVEYSFMINIQHEDGHDEFIKTIKEKYEIDNLIFFEDDIDLCSISIVPNKAIRFGDANDFVRKNVEKFCRYQNISLDENDHLIQTIVTIETKRDSNRQVNIRDHGINISNKHIPACELGMLGNIPLRAMEGFFKWKIEARDTEGVLHKISWSNLYKQKTYLQHGTFEEVLAKVLPQPVEIITGTASLGDVLEPSVLDNCNGEKYCSLNGYNKNSLSAIVWANYGENDGIVHYIPVNKLIGLKDGDQIIIKAETSIHNTSPFIDNYVDGIREYHLTIKQNNLGKGWETFDGALNMLLTEAYFKKKNKKK